MRTTNTKLILLRSSEVIDMVLLALGLNRKTLSTYKDYPLENGGYIRLRISDHGIYLQNWFDYNKNKRSTSPFIPKINVGQNLAITFAPNSDECQERGLPFPIKIKNVTSAKTEAGNNVKPQFSVRHICYYTWRLSYKDIQMISAALIQCIADGTKYAQPLQSRNKYVEWLDTSNLPPKKITK